MGVVKVFEFVLGRLIIGQHASEPTAMNDEINAPERGLFPTHKSYLVGIR